jgi:hypothetical protein
VRDSGALKLPSPRIQGLIDISLSDSSKHELDDQGEGSQFSPSRRNRKQVRLEVCITRNGSFKCATY